VLAWNVRRSAGRRAVGRGFGGWVRQFSHREVRNLPSNLELWLDSRIKTSDDVLLVELRL
jgi:hypothetical protein